MAITKFSRNYHEKMFPKYHSAFLETDPEFIERFDNFAFDEVVNSDDLDDKTRFIAILASLLGCQGVDEFSVMLGAAMNFGVTPVEIREIVYQATAYLGIGRVFPKIMRLRYSILYCCNVSDKQFLISTRHLDLYAVLLCIYVQFLKEATFRAYTYIHLHA